MKRKIVCNVGPTNSGKTYQAMLHLAESEGVFCGPLRLLAYEGYKTLSDKGCKVNLITGETRIENYNYKAVRQVCSTIEMANINRKYKVGILDEIQMIACPQRGYGWSRALLNLPAETLYVCGEERAVPLCERLIKTYTDDDFQVNTFKRLSPLEIMKKHISNQEVKKGDCILCFGRKQVLMYKGKMEAIGLKVSVIYGTLPPEARVEQARLFNEGINDIIIGTDAIGMGLNLQIQRIIFSESMKFNGNLLVYLEDPTVRQLAGRAGRFSSNIQEGLVTAFEKPVLDFVRGSYNSVPVPIEEATLSFTLEELHKIKENNPKYKLKDILQHFFDTPVPAGFKYQDVQAIIRVSNLITPLEGYSLRDQYSFLLAPVKIKRMISLSESFFLYIISRFIKGEFADPLEFFRTRTLIRNSNLFSKNPSTIWTTYANLTNIGDVDFIVRPLPSQINSQQGFNVTASWNELFSKDAFKIQNSNIVEDMYSCISLYLWIRNRFYFHPTFNFDNNTTVTTRILEDALEFLASICSKSVQKSAIRMNFGNGNPKEKWSFNKASASSSPTTKGSQKRTKKQKSKRVLAIRDLSK